MSDILSFSIQNPRQIINNLSLLIKSKCLISVRFGTNNESYITTLLGINEKNNVLILDYGPKEDLNQHILNANKVTFDTEYTGIKVSFIGSALKKITYKGEAAFEMSIPKSLYWMQRREYFRVKSPLSKSSYCQLILKDRDPVNLKLYDISLTGFAMLNVSKEISDLLIPGTSFSGCKLVLSEAGEGPISFEICAKYIINPDKLQKIQKIGCRFIKITRPVEEIIQRYMQQIQREDLQKKE
ncbi:MAG: flagellar brake protein [Methylobacter sp.]|nr:MAG: flagellar brake protein [Methylobacter sp.]